MGRISAVIPTWNRSHLLATVLGDLAAQTRPPEEVIVVDNGSEDDSAKVAKAHGAEVIRLDKNLGFARAVNAGIRRATGDWILILNNDLVLPQSWLEQLCGAAQREGAAFAAGKLLSYHNPDLIDGSWDLLSRGAHAWRCGFGRPDGPKWSVRRSIDFAPMTAALFHRRVFDTVGLLDERFEAYYEDVEFGLRCALAGLRGVYEPAAVARHMGKATMGKSSARVLFLTARNQMFVIAKHFPASTVAHWFWPIVVGQALSLLGAARAGSPIAAMRGLLEGLWRASEVRLRAADGDTLRRILSRSESEIRELQSELGFDAYWRLYFSLVRSA